MKIKLKGEEITILIIGLFLLVYSIIRAATLSFTIDEAATFFYIKNIHISHLANGFNANTHILNTLLSGIFYLIFGVSEWALRLPNLLAHALFIYYTYLITKKWFKGIYLVAGFLFLNLNPFMFEFFSLSRGYGLSIAFTLASIYHLISVFEKPTTNKEISKTLIFGCLAVFSNLMALNYFLVLIAILVYFKWKELWQNKTVFFITAITLVLNVYIGIYLKDKGQLYYGGINGIHQDTIRPFINTAFVLNFHRISFEENVFNIIKIVGTVIFYMISAGLLFNYKWKKIFDRKQPTENIIFLFLLGTFLSPVIQFYLFDTPLPHKRTGLLIGFIFSLNILFFFKKLIDSKSKIVSTDFKVLFLFFALLISLNFANSINLQKTMSWPENADVKTLASDLVKKDPQIQSIFTEIFLEKTLRFYFLKENLNADIKTIKWNNEPHDFNHQTLYIYKDNLKYILNTTEFRKEYPSSNTIFIKLKGFKTL
jgi:uncharacterized membrane protein